MIKLTGGISVEQYNILCFNNNNIFFTIDCTLWPFWIAVHVDPPFHLNK